LTEKQKRFAKEYAKSLNGTQAYKKVYGSTEKTARTNAAKLLANTCIKKEVDKTKEKFNRKFTMTAEGVLTRIEDMAEDDNNPSGVRIKALELLGKHFSLLTDRVDLTNSDGNLKPVVNIYMPANDRK